MTDRSHDRAGNRRITRRVGALVVTSALIVSAAACSGSDDDAVDAPTVAELDAAIERAETAEAKVETLESAMADTEELTEELATARAETAEVTDELELLEIQAQADSERADMAEARVAEIEAVAGQFPIELDSSLIPEDMPGTYEITFAEAYCDGFGTCGQGLAPTDATIYYTDDEFLRVGVDGVLDAGLFALDGSLYGITDSFTALAPCGDVERRARITMTLYAGSISILDDGTRVVNDLNASITIDAPEEGADCPSGLVFYASSLTPAG